MSKWAFLLLAYKSIRFRKKSLFLTLFSLTLSVVLILSIERIQKSIQENLTQSVSQVDLVVGARGSSLSLILYSIFNIGSASNNISYESYKKIANDERVEWTIPYSLGDGHKGFRVVATTSDFFKHYRFKRDESPQFREGLFTNQTLDVVLGSEVQKKLNYKLQDPVVIAHGSTTGDSFVEHSDRPFKVSGVLKPTGTAIDRTLYISLSGMEALHIDFNDFKALDSPETQLITKSITSFFLRTKNRVQTLSLQRDINTFAEEPLSAAIPGVVLNDLWQSLNTIDLAMRSIIWIVGAVSLASLMSIMLILLGERRREMGILRSLGAPASTVIQLLTIEGFLISLSSVVFGYLLVFILGFVVEPLMLNQYGFRLSSGVFTLFNLYYSLVIIAAGTSVSALPAWLLYRKKLKENLSVKN